jgi:hypothetical protein
LEALASNPLLAHTYGSQQTEGSAAMDVEAEIAKKVKEMLASDSSMNALTARQNVLAANPDLEVRANQAAQAAFGSFDPFESRWSGTKGLTGVNASVAK